MPRYLLLILILIHGVPAAAVPNIVVTTKPIHSLVSGVMRGVAEPILLMQGPQSPHHYAVKPSERRLLANADLIIWIGADMETTIARILDKPAQAKHSLTLLEEPGMKILPRRYSTQHGIHSAETLDGHIWLSTHNAMSIVDSVAERLIAMDAVNKTIYTNNQAKMHSKIVALREQIHETLKNTTKHYLSYHDAYQYFEKEFHLQSIGFVVTDHELSPSAKKVVELKDAIKTRPIQCLFFESPTMPPIVNTLISNTNVKAVELDPAGIHLNAGEDTWFTIMESLATHFHHCLQ